MNKKRGQALVEFAIIFPVFIFIILAIFDYSLIIYNKNNLENKLEETVMMYENESSISKINAFLKSDNITLTISKLDDKYIKLILTKDIDTITPGLKSLIGNPYQISSERVILNES